MTRTNINDGACTLCRHYNAMLATIRREPFLGYVPCPSCVRFNDSRTDKFERVSGSLIDKMYQSIDGQLK